MLSYRDIIDTDIESDMSDDESDLNATVFDVENTHQAQNSLGWTYNALEEKMIDIIQEPLITSGGKIVSLRTLAHGWQ